MGLSYASFPGRPSCCFTDLFYLYPLWSQLNDLKRGLTANGEYSIKNGALLAQQILPSSLENVEYNWIWKLNIPPKIKSFLWKACNDGILSKLSLEKSHIFLPQQWVCCNNAS